MTDGRQVTLLAHGAVAAICVTLVAAAFALPPAQVRSATNAVAIGERAGPMARHAIREPEVAIASVALPDEPTDDVLVAPPPTFAPDPVVVTEPVVTEPVVTEPVVIAPVEGAAAAELAMLALMNNSRSAGGLAPLTLDAGVSAAARAHSAAESAHGYVYHDGADGSARVRDAAACGTGWYGENTGKVWNENVRALHVEFMSEPWEPINHRTNIMDPAFRRVGIGAVFGRDAMYLTMVFCR